MKTRLHGRVSLADRAHEALRQLIIHHRIERGHKISLHDTAERLEVSLTPLREALGKLTQEGFVVHHRNRGYFVADSTPDEAAQLFDTRIALECEAVRAGISRLTEGRVRSISRAVEAYAGVVDRPDRERFLQDKKLHLEIARTADNPILGALLEQIIDRIIMKLPVEELPRERGPQAALEHRDILSALSGRDANSAVAMMRAHLERSKTYIVGFLTERERAS